MHTPHLLRAASVLPLALGVALSMSCDRLWAQPIGRQTADRSASALPDPLRQLAERLGRRWNVVILVDPALPRASLSEMPADDLPVEASLELALASRRRVAWRRVRLPPGQDESPLVETLAAAARALEQRELGSVLIEDLTAQRVTVCLKDEPLPSAVESARSKPDSTAAPLHLVYSTTPSADGDTPIRRFADLQRQQLELPAAPENRALAMVQVVRLLQEMPPADMEAFASRTLQAGMPLWESTTPEQRREMIQQSMQMMKAFDAGLQRDAARRGGPHRPLPVQSGRRGDPKALAAALSGRFGVTVLVDPALAVASPPELPAMDASVEGAFAAVTRELPGSAWRRVYLTEAQQKRLPSAEKLAAWVRTLEQLEPDRLVLQQAATRPATVYRKAEPLEALPALRRRGGFGDQPIYLILSTTPAARGGTLEERLLDLQRQQIGLMLRLSPEQMAQTMAQTIRAFPAADAGTRARLMALPAMAGLMAVWMPREAKEGGQPLTPAP
jgi:hypothetical protein